MTKWTAVDIPDQTGRTVVVTGANSGLGLRSAEALAAKGARVLLACRNAQKAAAALDAVAAKATGPAPEVVSLDLSDLSSVRAAAARLDGELEHLDVLLNNAGVMAVPKAATADGFEMQFGTNHLGPFALTGLLLPALLRAPEPRVVNVSSNAHKFGSMRWDDLNWEKGRYSRWRAYGQSKLANLLFTSELQRRAVAASTPLTAVAAHPGYASTNLTSGPAAGNPIMGFLTKLSDKLVGQSDQMGALPQLYASTMPDVGAGDYWGPDALREQRGHPTRVGRTSAASDTEAAAKLWARSEELTGVTYPWPA
ncbi:MAG: oxidoreductase [Actinomycetota bacterium]|nr:SDR family NAD(P)-dependent oxidoreductase [Acidimicrobiia bacterium]MDQ3294004.1 oxidoreductase [Actinomycetota bacterium]